MIGSEFLAIAYGLASAASWGAGDFSGGFATKRNNVYSVVLIAHFISGILLVALALLFNESLPTWNDILLGGLAGFFGMLGLMALYRGLAIGRMGLVAPVTAVTTAALPIGVSFFLEGAPTSLQLAGFLIALIAVVLLAGVGGSAVIKANELLLAVVAGLGFALFYIVINQVSQNAVLWPLVSGRIVTVTLLFLFVRLTNQWSRPTLTDLPAMALAGIFDTGGNVFFVLAAQAGRLDIASVISSLYPAMTVLLAWVILKERLIKQQWIGVIAAIVALVLIAV